MNKDDEIREELSDLWCKEITGQLKGSEKIRLQNLIEEREFPFPDRKRWLSRLRQKEEFDSAIAYRKFLPIQKQEKVDGGLGVSVLPQRQPFCCLWDWTGLESSGTATVCPPADGKKMKWWNPAGARR